MPLKNSDVSGRSNHRCGERKRTRKELGPEDVTKSLKSHDKTLVDGDCFL